MAKTKAFDENVAQYEDWFVNNSWVFKSELEAIRKVLPPDSEGIEIGIGSGIFAEPLGIREGIEPSGAMREKAEQRGLKVINAVAEALPYADESRDFALMVTTICFVDDVKKSLEEAHRVIKDHGSLIIGFVDKDSEIGKSYQQHKNESVFYREADFVSTQELQAQLELTGFKITGIYQTVFGQLDEIKELQAAIPGHGKGSFVIIKAQKLKAR